MKFCLVLFSLIYVCSAYGEEKIQMNFKNEDLLKVIEVYSKASRQKFIVDSNLRGKISIFLPSSVSVPEAFNHLSSALAVNGFAITKREDTMVIKQARQVQRDLLEVGTEIPSVNPERLYTWIYTFKNIAAQSAYRDLRILTSKDGEIVVNDSTNQILMSDWTSNINRAAAICKHVDIKVDSSTAKIVANTQKKKRKPKKKQ